MKRRTKWLAVSAISLSGMIACLYFSGPRQPSYQGRYLDEWLADLASPHFKSQQLARAAIRAMGPATVPFLTNSLDQRKALSIRAKGKSILPQRFVNWGRKVVKWQSPMIESRNAASALQSLGQNAANAIPALVAALSDPSPVIAQAAAVALGSMESAAVPALRERLRAAGPNELPWVLHAVIALGTNAAPLAPELGMILENPPNAALGDWAVMACARIGPDAIAVVERAFENTNRDVILRGLSVLSQIGAPGIAATNVLFQLSRSEDSEIRLRARQAFGAANPAREVALPIWLEGLRDSDSRNIEVSLWFLTIYPTNVRAFNCEIAALASHPTNSIREIASNALTRLRAWPEPE